ncbi:hypothetical protein NQ035_01145 [Staphylococcus gallinarum]|uniref:Uncharacterized protein n=1 Tax=Staphylococcus gallinarum TaxID=1293 RepID=A0A2T4SY32_STAGA|nr:hypothetical protein [Staphylococcus gallinarum]MCD8819969.1 hypothetical protein [Staphylococcus gallinarum]MCD8826049.1 hypothetical protein [Staphylococcus gallinarum]MCD8870149.1 hypothetical protein [Staphylococcus gallinarum]MCQ9287462.1 hypothetical protein [Staphylococcus gallinarum]MCW0985184.1 hypothetical protein [Staphylococcus gallinarum]
MNKRVLSGLKVGLTVLLCVILVVLILNYIGVDIDQHRIWNNLGDLGLINIFVNKELNGLIILGLILIILSFAFGYNYPSNKN